MGRDDVKTTGKPGGLWERVVRAWRGAREGWVGGGESHDVASNSPWPHPIPQSRPEPPSRRRDGVGALSRHDLVEALASGVCLSTPPLRFTIADDLPKVESAHPHNALADARALRRAYLRGGK